MTSTSEDKQHNKYILEVEPLDAGQRLDKYITSKIPDLSRTKAQNLINDLMVTSKSQPLTDSNYKVRANDIIEIEIKPKDNKHIAAKDIPINVVYEDDDLMVINKQAGLTVHPGAGNYSDTLVNALIAHFGDKLSQVGGPERPGIVHRLDRDTSGVMVVAKNDKSHRSLGKQLEKRALKRTYQAIIWGVLHPKSGKIETNIGRSKLNRKKMAVYRNSGKKAVTHYKTLEVFGDNLFSLVECQLETGRTHQIRVHMTHKSHSIVGDQTYGNPKKKLPKELSEKIQKTITEFPRQALHAVSIAFQHPTTSKNHDFSVALPKDIAALLKTLKLLQK